MIQHQSSCKLWIALILLAGPVSVFAADRITDDVLAVCRTRPSVGNIHTEKAGNAGNSVFAAEKGKKIGMGTGIIIDETGYMVTNYHVIADVDTIRVDIEDEGRVKTSYLARRVCSDKEHDLAIIKIDGPASKPFKVMPCGTSSDLMLCEKVIAIGNAYGYDGTVTTGIISSLDRNVEANESVSYKNLIQTDAAINPGNSGGPLINVKGEVIGINVAIRANSQKIGFAIPIDDARKVIAKMISVETIDRTFHGLITKDVVTTRDPETGPIRQVVVESYHPDSPAARAGFRSGDLIVKAGAVDVYDSVDFERALLHKRAGDVIEVTLKRNESIEKKPLTLAQFTGGRVALNPDVQVTPRANNDDSDRFWSQLGLRLIALPNSEKSQLGTTRHREGMKVLDVRSDGPAALNGIRKGDILVGLEKWETASVANITWILNHVATQPVATETPNQIRFLIVRAKEERSGVLQLSQTPPRTAAIGN